MGRRDRRSILSRRSIFSCVRTGVAALGLAVFGSAGVAYGQDVVITTSGDRLVGEIKRVEKDVLTLETAYSDADFKIEWEDVAVDRKQSAVPGGDIRRKASVGLVEPDPDKKPIVQIAGTSVPLAEVSVVQPFERTFWSRFDTALDFGYSMTRANSAKQLSLGTNTLLPGRALCRCHLRQRLQELAGERSRDRALGSWQ